MAHQSPQTREFFYLKNTHAPRPATSSLSPENGSQQVSTRINGCQQVNMWESTACRHLKGYGFPSGGPVLAARSQQQSTAVNRSQRQSTPGVNSSQRRSTAVDGSPLTQCDVRLFKKTKKPELAVRGDREERHSHKGRLLLFQK